jgi:hypothetical protein
MQTPSPAPPFRCGGSATLGDAAGGDLTTTAPMAFTVCRGSIIVHGAGIAVGTTAGTVDGGTGNDKDKSVVAAFLGVLPETIARSGHDSLETRFSLFA